MRVIAGDFRSRTIQAPRGSATRPSSDRLRETLFNVLAPRIQGACFLDLYAGSGAVGIEAISRGASSVVFVEQAPPALVALRTNLARLGISENFRIQAESVSAFLRRARPASPPTFGLIFLDPPWDAAEEYTATLRMLGSASPAFLAPGAMVIAEHRRKQPLEEAYGSLHRTRLLKQGDAALSFYTLNSEQGSS